jgi:hypothetical protein
MRRPRLCLVDEVALSRWRGVTLNESEVAPHLPWSYGRTSRLFQTRTSRDSIAQRISETKGLRQPQWSPLAPASLGLPHEFPRRGTR